MGNLIHKLMRPIRIYDIERRAEKVLSQDKPTPAPRHAKTEKLLSQLNQSKSDFIETHNKKNTLLDERLKNVYVTAVNPEVSQPESSHRPLPQARGRISDDDVYYEPKIIPKGKCSLQQIVQLLSKRQSEPAIYTDVKLALEYKLDPQVVRNITKYYNLFELHIPANYNKLNDGITDKIFKVLRNVVDTPPESKKSK